MPFDSTQSKQQYGTKITCTDIRGEVMVIGTLIFFKWGGGYFGPDL